MMNLQQLQALIDQGESETLEFKTSSGEVKEACETVCGMLNAQGGHVLIGVKNDGSLKGQTVSDTTRLKIQQELSKIEPAISLEPDYIGLRDNLFIIALRVARATKGPFVYNGRPYIRRGPQTNLMPQELYNRILTEKMHASSRWELLPSSLGFEHLDHEEIIRTLEEAISRGRQADPYTRDIKAVLMGFGLLKQGQLLNAAAMLFAKDEAILPDYAQFRLRMARFRGNDKSEFIDSRQFYGNAFRLLQHAQNFLLQHLPVAGRVIPGVIERQDDPIFPLIALREALANALCHRDYELGGGSVSIAIYDNRLEITSSGDLHFGLTVDELFKEHESHPWNPLIASVFHKRGIIETWGRGTLIMKEQTEKAGLVAPVIEAVAGSVTVRFSPTRYSAPHSVLHDLTDRQKVLLEYLGKNAEEQFAMRELTGVFSAQEWSDRMLREDLQFLKTLNLVELQGHGRSAKWSIKRE